MISWKLLISFFSVHINIISYHSKLNVENLICINYISAACPSGRFGLDCINRCDTYCSGSKSCDPVIGICSEGCKQGYSGLMCGLGKVTNYALNLIKIVWVINLRDIKFLKWKKNDYSVTSIPFKPNITPSFQMHVLSIFVHSTFCDKLFILYNIYILMITAT